MLFDVSKYLLEKLLKNHTHRNSQCSPISLSLRYSIVIIVDIDWNFSNLESLLLNLIDEFTRIFHPIHAEKYLHHDSRTKHSIAIMCIRELHSRDYGSENLATPEKNPSEKWNIRIGFHDKT